jgi:DNA-directed RNA polymerase, mitochondrial
MTTSKTISKTPLELEIIQVELEKGMTEAGKVRFEQRRVKNMERGTEADNAYGSSLIAQYTHRLAGAIQAVLDDAASGRAGKRHSSLPLISQLDPSVTAYLTLKGVINHLSTRKPLQHILGAIGGMIDDEIRFRAMREEDKKLYEVMLEEAKKRTSYFHKRMYMKRAAPRLGFAWDTWTNDVKVRVGEKLLDILMGAFPDMVEVVTQVEGKNNTMKYLKATPQTLEFMEKRNALGALSSPIYEPMVVPPLDWDSAFGGGYLTSFVRPLTMVKSRSRAYLESLDQLDMPIVKTALSAMQQTRWNVNQEVLEVMEKFWDNGGGVAGLPLRFEKPVPPKPLDFDTNEEAKRAWKLDAAHVHKQNLEITSVRAGFRQCLNTAEKYAPFEAIHFPHQLDFRGRCYPVTAFNPQGPDWMKSLLRFADGKPMGDEGGAWLAVQGSNLMGVDKVSFEDRVQFILDNEEEILAIARDPFENKGWIAGFAGRTDDNGKGKETDSPWQFLAFCFEWAQYCEQGEEFISRIPVALDGTCSGLQHYAMALACEDTGKFVNLIPADKPQDIYGEVARKVLLRLEEDSKSGTEDVTQEITDEETGEITKRHVPGTKSMATQWLKFGVTRSTTKRAVMTTAYGSREFGFREQLMDDILKPAKRKATDPKTREVNREEFPFDKDGFAAAGYMAKLIWAGVSATVVRAVQAMDWLKETASILGSEGLPVKWTTPAGFPVQQAYRNMSPRRVESQIAGSRVVLTVATPLDTIDRRAQASAIAPNVIHSWDAAQLMLTVQKCVDQGLTNFALVHDSFGTTAGDLPVLYRAVREAMYEQYKDGDVFDKWKEEVVEQLDDKNRQKVSPLPSPGSLDRSLILDSRYCFA